ncbi:MAG: ribosomal protection-like ABC-F family protein [Candidatus Hydrogenedentales bacterium]|jgi:ATP-binding cassette subfamily F protein 3
MSLIRLENVCKSYSGERLLDNVNFRIENGERIALIGRNGTGKTTLFRLITGETETDGGVVERMRRIRTVYLSQIPEVSPEQSIYEIALHSFADLLEQEKVLQELEHRLAQDSDEVLLTRYGELQHLFTQQGGYEFRVRTRQILCGLGFHPDEFTKPFQSLSGGWRARLLLSLALLRDADLLLLDEPENHLDMEAREWLEEHLRNRPEAIVLISHDRRMVNTLARRVIELERGEALCFTGNYDRWLKEKLLRREQQQRAFSRQDAFIQKEMAWIDRFRYKNTKARQAQNRLKRLERLEVVEAPPAEMGAASFQMGAVERSGDIVLNAQDLSMGYNGSSLYSGLSFSLHRGDRLGIIGPNGSGKTTLLRQLIGKHKGWSGTIWMGANVMPAFYDQHQESLQNDRDLLSEMQAFRPDWSAQLCRNHLARFLFTGDEVFKATSILSGGERSRLALAKLVASDANLLLLDEPTNHLDMASREALESALEDYEGTLVVVSHDRTLIDKVAERLVVIEEGKAQLFYGNFSDWRLYQKEQGLEERRIVDEETVERRQKQSAIREEKKAQEREDRRKQRRVEALEKEIEAAEDAIEALNSRFAEIDPADFSLAQSLKEEYDTIQQAVESLYEEWTALQEE